MKLSIVLIVVTLATVSAKSYSQIVTLHKKSASVAEILQLIEEQTGYHFLYNDQEILTAGKIDVDVDQLSVQEALDKSFEHTRLNYRIFKTIIVVSLKKEKLAPKPIPPAKQLAIKGRVTDGQGQGLQGVSILVKGTTNGTATEADGSFMLNVQQETGTLVISYIGFETQEKAYSTAEAVNIVLTADNQSLGEVVVTALGIRREKRALTYAVTEVDGEKFTQAREINLGNALSGRVAGVNATSAAGGAGAASRIIIRGNGSLAGDNQPLIVVNGIPISNSNQAFSSASGASTLDRGNGLSSINPDDIENISVLKGGTAAALYGSRAANGVILITTKSGQAQQGIGIEFNSVYTFENPSIVPDWQYEYGAGTRGQAPVTQGEAIANGRVSWGAKLDGSMVMQPDGVARPYVAQKDNIKKFYDTGATFSNTLALNGGTEAANFRFSASNMDNNGIVPNATINRKIFNLSANANLLQKVVFEGSAQYSIETAENRTSLNNFTNNPNSSVALLATNIDVRTLAPGYDANGYETEWNDYIYTTNPYFVVNKVKNGDERRRFIGSFSTRYNVTDFLYARARLGIDYANFHGFDIAPSGIQYNARGNMTDDRNIGYETNAELILGFEKEYGNFSVNVLAGGNQMKNKFSGVGLNSGLLNIPFQYFIRNGSSPAFDQSYRASGINSVFGSADIGMNNYLFLTLTGRQDWFSTLSTNNNSLFYPSVGLSFLFSDVWKTKPAWLNYGSVRGSWAQVGGGAPDPYGLNLVYEANATIHLGRPLMNIVGGTVPSDLKPYTSTTTEFGLAMRMFDNRLNADITVYDRTTTNDIVRAAVAPSSSYSNVSLNVGKMKNRGIEMLLTGTPIATANGLNWQVSYNMAYNKNTVIKIADGLTTLSAGGGTRSGNGYVYHYEGKPFGMVSGYEFMKDDNGNTVYNAVTGMPIRSEFIPLGRGVPPLTLGLANDFSYKNFSFSFLVDGKFGSKMYSATNDYAAFYGKDKRTVANNVREDGITASGVDTEGNPFTQTLTAQNYYQMLSLTYTSPFVYDASFVKLRQITLGYSFPQSLLSKTPFQYANLSLVARNLLLLYSEIPNIDPESANYNGNGQGVEGLGTLPTRSYGINLMVRF